MKLILLSILFLVGCGTESDPLGIKVLDEWHYETIDACRGIDISDNILVAAASSNGYFRFDISSQVSKQASLLFQFFFVDTIIVYHFHFFIERKK